jgi:hypothetical protein
LKIKYRTNTPMLPKGLLFFENKINQLLCVTH